MGGARSEGDPCGRGRGLRNPRLSATRTGVIHSEEESLVCRTRALGTSKVFFLHSTAGFGLEESAGGLGECGTVSGRRPEARASSWVFLDPSVQPVLQKQSPELPILVLPWRVGTPLPLSPFFFFSFFPFPGPFIPFLQIQTVLSQIQSEEMFSSCFTKGVRLLSSFFVQPGRA